MESYDKNIKTISSVFVIFVILLVGFIFGCGKDSSRQLFELEIINELPDKWKYFAVDAVEDFLNQSSNRYDQPLLYVIEKKYPDLFEKYRSVKRECLDAWEGYQCSSESDKYNRLVKKILELQRLQAKQLKDKRKQSEEFDKTDVKREPRISPDIEAKRKKVIEEKYELCLQLLNRNNYDDYRFTIYNIGEKDEYLSVNKIAILYIYFSGLPNIEVYFYKDLENSNWTHFYTTIDIMQYYLNKSIK